MDFPHYGDPLAEIGHIWGFWALSGELVEVNVQSHTKFLLSCIEHNVVLDHVMKKFDCISVHAQRRECNIIHVGL